LFEVTGVGTLLLTDNKKDTKDFFRTGEEIITYTDEVDCLNKIRYYLAHEDGCISIAKAGQRRTLSNHTFGICMKELAAIIEKNIQNR
jgi:spore maturation protein CgeB